MKKIALLSMLLGLGLFVAGCAEAKKSTPAVKPAGGGATTAPDPATTGEAKDGEHEHMEGEEHKDGEAGEAKTDEAGEAKTGEAGEAKTDEAGEAKTDEAGEAKTDEPGEAKPE